MHGARSSAASPVRYFEIDGVGYRRRVERTSDVMPRGVADIVSVRHEFAALYQWLAERVVAVLRAL
jgi:hypothetical protein